MMAQFSRFRLKGLIFLAIVVFALPLFISNIGYRL